MGSFRFVSKVVLAKRYIYVSRPIEVIQPKRATFWKREALYNKKGFIFHSSDQVKGTVGI